MLQAELIILSKSSFSLVPAIMNERAKVIYVPFLHGKLSKWETVSDEMINAAQDNVKALLTSCPKLEWENNCTQETHCFLDLGAGRIACDRARGQRLAPRYF